MDTIYVYVHFINIFCSDKRAADVEFQVVYIRDVLYGRRGDGDGRMGPRRGVFSAAGVTSPELAVVVAADAGRAHSVLPLVTKIALSCPNFPLAE